MIYVTITMVVIDAELRPRLSPRGVGEPNHGRGLLMSSMRMPDVAIAFTAGFALPIATGTLAAFLAISGIGR